MFRSLHVSRYTHWIGFNADFIFIKFIQNRGEKEYYNSLFYSIAMLSREKKRTKQKKAATKVNKTAELSAYVKMKIINRK
jgi:hypothetical protein